MGGAGTASASISAEGVGRSRGAGMAYLVASGDLRLLANRDGWPAQAELEAALAAVFADQGWSIRRANMFDAEKGHGFIDSQRRGMEVFSSIPADAPVVVAESIWQYSHHVLAGLRDHRGPILTVANFSGKWPGLVGLLNLNASLTKIGKPYGTAWSEDFCDPWFVEKLKEWLATGRTRHDEGHVRAFVPDDSASARVGGDVAEELLRSKAIVGVFDEGCMGMYSAIIDDELLNPLGIYKERLSQSALYAEMRRVGDDEAYETMRWLLRRGMQFRFGPDPGSDLTEDQVHQQLKMYTAALRIADDFGLDAVGIQYQQGLKDLVPASDLAEGLLNDTDRPPVRSRDGSRVLWEGKALPHFNEVDEGSAVDALVTNRVWEAMGIDPATTLHDIRWGRHYDGSFVWVFMISGAVPPTHLVGGYAGAVSERQPARYFPLGGGTIKGVSKPGQVVWSRLYVASGALHLDTGRASVVQLPAAETDSRWQLTTPQWPIMHAVLHGVSRDQMMARHKANHIQVAYAPSAELAHDALMAKAHAFHQLGVEVHLCGTV